MRPARPAGGVGAPRPCPHPNPLVSGSRQHRGAEGGPCLSGGSADPCPRRASSIVDARPHVGQRVCRASFGKKPQESAAFDGPPPCKTRIGRPGLAERTARSRVFGGGRYAFAPPGPPHQLDRAMVPGSRIRVSAPQNSPGKAVKSLHRFDALTGLTRGVRRAGPYPLLEREVTVKPLYVVYFSFDSPPIVG